MADGPANPQKMPDLVDPCRVCSHKPSYHADIIRADKSKIKHAGPCIICDCRACA